MRIAACDDDADVLKELRDILISINRTNEVSLYTSAEELLEAYELGERYDLLLLDVVMDKKTGLEAAKEIRSKDKGVMIVFISYYNEYIEEAFDVDAMKYTLKPIKPDKILAIYQRCLVRYQERNQKISVKVWDKDGALQLTYIMLNEIMYVTMQNKDMLIYGFKEQCIRAMGPLKDYKEILMNHGFVNTYRGTMVNLKFIETVGSDVVTLKENAENEITRLPLTQGNRKEVEEAFSNHTFPGSWSYGYNNN